MLVRIEELFLGEPGVLQDSTGESFLSVFPRRTGSSPDLLAQFRELLALRSGEAGPALGGVGARLVH